MSEALKRIEEKYPKAQHWQADRDVVKLARALDALATKLREIEASPEYREVFLLAHIHGQPYTGPNSHVEQREAERTLEEVAGTKGCTQDDGTPWPTKYGCGGEKCDDCEA